MISLENGEKTTPKRKAQEIIKDGLEVILECWKKSSHSDSMDNKERYLVNRQVKQEIKRIQNKFEKRYETTGRKLYFGPKNEMDLQ